MSKIFRNPIAEEIGYEEKTTFWDDFSIADKFGISAIKDTYNRAFQEWHDNLIYLTELVLVLNWKIWQYCEKRPELAETYNSLWEKTDNYACEHLTGDDLQYYFNITD